MLCFLCVALGFYLRKLKFYRCLSAENADFDLQALFFVIHFFYRAGKRIERSVNYLDRIAFVERRFYGRYILTLFDSADYAVDFVRTQCLRLPAGTHKTNHCRDICKNVFIALRNYRIDQDITRKEITCAETALAVTNLVNVLLRDKHFVNLVLQAHALDFLFDVRLYFIFLTRKRAKSIPLRLLENIRVYIVFAHISSSD